MATIHITNLRLRAIIGANDWERDTLQEVIINITIDFDADGVRDLLYALADIAGEFLSVQRSAKADRDMPLFLMRGVNIACKLDDILRVLRYFFLSFEFLHITFLF